MGMNKQQYLGPYIECPRRKNAPHHFEILDDELREFYVDDKTKIFLGPNVRRRGAPEPRISDDAICMDLQNVDIKTEMEWFRSAFAAEIEKLEKVYGTITLRWGLCQWYS